MKVFDLLIIYSDGTEKTVSSVSDYYVEDGCFCYVKNAYRSFLPIKYVKFFGRKYDYKSS